MNGNFFALMFRMKYINRWGLMRQFYNENLSEHSLECCILAYALATIGNRYFNKSYDIDHIALKAAFHDAPEIITGDMPTPVKYYSDTTKHAYKTVEDDAVFHFLSLIPAPLQPDYSELFDYSPNEKLIIKAADKLCAYIKCLCETSSGNSEFKSALVSTRQIIDSYDCVELNYFMNNCINAFTLSLDELQKHN